MHSPITIGDIGDLAGRQPTKSPCAAPSKAPLAGFTATGLPALPHHGNICGPSDAGRGRTMTFPGLTTALERAPAAGGRHSPPDPAGRALRSETTAKPCIARPSTRGAAIAAFCKDCGHDPGARGTWREQVAACVAGNCPLHRFRPMPRGIVHGSPALAALRLRLDTTGEAGV